MATWTSRTASVLIGVSGLGFIAPAAARQAVQQPAPPECTANLAQAGTMRDILSNALVRGFKFPSHDVRPFLDGAQDRYATGAELLKAAAAHFKIPEDALAAKVEKYKHCNCKHPVESALHPGLRVDPQPHAGCTVDLEIAGIMGDLLSSTLIQGGHAPERDVAAFLGDSDEKFEDGPEVFKATAVRFKFSEDALAAELQKFRHCNCDLALDGAAAAGGGRADDGLPVSPFAKDVTLHVVLHELGHALIREFDIPVLGNEETVADAFATYYLTTYLPDRAVDVLTARTTSLMIEAAEQSGTHVEWAGEHDHDARRANQIAALAVAADPVKYRPVAAIVGMSDEDIKKARDYGAEIRRSWRRVLAPLWMPQGAASAEARVLYDADNGFLNRLCADGPAGQSGLAGEIESAVKRFDWHSQVTVRFVDGDGGAAWSRSGRTINVHSAYVRRFIEQGGRGLPPARTDARPEDAGGTRAAGTAPGR